MSLNRAAASERATQSAATRTVSAAIDLMSNWRQQAAAGAETAVIDGWQPREGHILTVTRAISARVNQNYDGFPSEELRKAYKTFLGKPVFVNHQNEDPTRARGRVVGTRYVENGADKYIEVIQEVNAKKFPLLAKELIEAGLDSVSMGCSAERTICSFCGNVATGMFDMCTHVLNFKGQKLRRAGKNGQMEDVLVYEECRDLGFFELSYVFDPADETAMVSNLVVAGKGKSAEIKTPVPSAPRVYCDFPGCNRWTLHKSEKYSSEWVRNDGMIRTFDFCSDEHRAEYEARYPEWRMERGASRNPVKYYAVQKKAWGEREAPAAIDTLRDDRDEQEEEFHQYVKSPDGLAMPDLDKARELDRREEMGEGYEDFSDYLQDEVSDHGSLDEEMLDDPNAVGQLQDELEPEVEQFGPDEAVTDEFGKDPEDAETNPFAETDEGAPGEQPIGEDGLPVADDLPEDVMVDPDDLTDEMTDPDDLVPPEQKPGMETAPEEFVEQEPVKEKVDPDSLVEDDKPVEKTIEQPQVAPPTKNPEKKPSAPADKAAPPKESPSKKPPVKQPADNSEAPKPPKPDEVSPPAPEKSRKPNNEPAEKDSPVKKGPDDKGDKVPDHPDSGAESRDKAESDPEVDDEKEVGDLADQLGISADQLLQLDPEDLKALLDADEEKKMAPKAASRRTASDGWSSDNIGAREGYTKTVGRYELGVWDWSGDGFMWGWEVELASQGEVVANGTVNTREEAQSKAESYAQRFASRREARASQDFLNWVSRSTTDPLSGMSQEALDDLVDDFLAQAPGLYSDAEIDSIQRGLSQYASRKTAFSVGDRVTDGWGSVLGQGTVTSVNGELVTVKWDDSGDEESTSKASLKKASTTEEKMSRKDSTMSGDSLAQRGRVASRRRTADDSRNDQGEFEETFITQTPPPEPVETGEGEEINNTEENLVASIRAKQAELIRLRRARQRKQADGGFLGDGASEGETAEVVNPELSGTDDQDLKGDFESADPNEDVKETQPKDASRKAKVARRRRMHFAHWVSQNKGKKLADVSSVGELRSWVTAYCSETGVAKEAMYPIVRTDVVALRKAADNDDDGESGDKSEPPEFVKEKIEDSKESRKQTSAGRRKMADEKLDVAAPDGRVDVERPTADDTDDEAQASQFDKNDFGQNAGDDKADPDLSTNQNWAPGHGKSSDLKKASGVNAVRLARAYINAGLESSDKEWVLASQFEQMSAAVVNDRLALLERVVEVNASRRPIAQKTAGSRGARSATIPPNMPRAVAATPPQQRVAASDASSDSDLFI